MPQHYVNSITISVITEADLLLQLLLRVNQIQHCIGMMDLTEQVIVTISMYEVVQPHVLQLLVDVQ